MGSGEPFRHLVRFAHQAVADQGRQRPGATATSPAWGAGPETLVGVCLERGAEAIRGLLAIMKAGTQLPGVSGTRFLGPGDLARGTRATPG